MLIVFRGKMNDILFPILSDIINDKLWLKVPFT